MTRGFGALCKGTKNTTLAPLFLVGRLAQSSTPHLAKNTELYAMKAGTPIVKLFNIWHFMNKVALFHSQLCVGLDVWHKRFYVNQRT